MPNRPKSIEEWKLASKRQETLIRLLEAAGFSTAGQIRDIIKPNMRLASGTPRLKGQSGAKPKWSFELTWILVKRVIEFKNKGFSISYACRELVHVPPFSDIGTSPSALRSRFHRAWEGALQVFQDDKGEIFLLVRKTSGDGWVTIATETEGIIHLDNNFQQIQ